MSISNKIQKHQFTQFGHVLVSLRFGEKIINGNFAIFSHFNSTLELLHFVIDRGKAIEPLAILLWTFWLCRNSQNILSDHVSQFANDQLLEFEIVNSTCPSFPLDQSPLCRPRVHWISPSAGTVKINFNGASFKDADCAGIGVIICDEWGLRDCCTFPKYCFA